MACEPTDKTKKKGLIRRSLARSGRAAKPNRLTPEGADLGGAGAEEEDKGVALTLC